jgi:superfamily I DNA/RNA helicase
MKTIIVGRPGTGKTTWLLERIAEINEPERIIFISFTRKAIREARERAIKMGAEEKDLKYWRTIHSILARELGLKKDNFLRDEELSEFFAQEKIHFNSYFSAPNPDDYAFFTPLDIDELSDGEKILALKGRIEHITCKSTRNMSREEIAQMIRKYCADFLTDLQDFRFRLSTGIDFLADLIWRYNRLKDRLGKMDFEDIIFEWLKNPTTLDADYLFVDEFQDLSPLLYQVIKVMEEQTKEQYYAGDDAQAIYTFMGANPQIFIKEIEEAKKGNAELIELKISHRLKKNHANLANKVGKYTQSALPVEIIAKEDGGEIIHIYNEWDVVEYLRKLEYEDTVFLFRTNFEKRKVKEMLIREGIAFFEYGFGKRVWTMSFVRLFNAIIKLRRGERITNEELVEIIKRVPSKPFLIRGVKKQLETGKFMETLLGKRESWSAREINDILFRKESPKKIEDFCKDITLLRFKKGEEESFKALKIKLETNPRMINDKHLALSTIHSFKGGEAKNIILNFRLRRKKINFDDEVRVLYVAVTRTKDKIIIIEDTIPSELRELLY